jgi:hypothetical protein
VAVALTIYAGIAVAGGATDHFRFCDLIRIGHFLRPSALTPCPAHPTAAGYDGQFYFAIAHDPFLRNPDTAASLDDSLRYRRILYPLTAWLVSAGRPSLLPDALVIVNVGAGGALIAVLAAMAIRLRLSPWWSLLVALFGGVWMPIARDLTEPLQLMLLAIGMTTGSALALLLSSLAKETSVVALVTETLRTMRARLWLRASAFGLATIGVVGWTLFVRVFVTGPQASSIFGQFLRPPGAPLIVLVQTVAREPIRATLIAGGLAICVLVVARVARTHDGAAWAAAAYAAVQLGAGAESWHDPVDFYRQMAGAVVLVFISWAQTRDRLGLAVLWLGALTGGFSALLLAAGHLPR